MERQIHSRALIGSSAQLKLCCKADLRRVAVDYPSLALVLRGQKSMSWAGGQLQLGPGEFFAMPGGKIYDVVNIPDAEGLYESQMILFSNEILSPFFEQRQDLAPLTAPLKLGLGSHDFRDSYLNALDLIKGSLDLPLPVTASRVTELLTWIGLSGVRFVPVVPLTAVDQVKSLIQKSLDRDWKAPILAESMACSEATLRRYLAKEGTSFSEILLECRLNNGLNQVMATNLPIEQIAQANGYESPSRFAMLFRKRFGVTPRDLRGRHEPNDRMRAELDRIAPVSSLAIR
jgi:AraC-like DNA-binding protein